MLGRTLTVAGDVPPAGDTCSHAASSEAVQDTLPMSWLTERFFAAGSAPPAVAVNERLVGETDSVGAGGDPPIGVAMSAWIDAAVRARL